LRKLAKFEGWVLAEKALHSVEPQAVRREKIEFHSSDFQWILNPIGFLASLDATDLSLFDLCLAL
jgi:hypothetical protein